jgi:hypothetical protein
VPEPDEPSDRVERIWDFDGDGVFDAVIPAAKSGYPARTRLFVMRGECGVFVGVVDGVISPSPVDDRGSDGWLKLSSEDRYPNAPWAQGGSTYEFDGKRYRMVSSWRDPGNPPSSH